MKLKKMTQLHTVLIMILFLAGNAKAWEPNSGDLNKAIKTGDFAEYFANISSWLEQKEPADAAGISEGAMRDLLKDPAVVLALDQRQLIAKVGVGKLGDFARANEANQEFLSGLLKSTGIMDLYLEAGEPRDREYVGSLDVLRRIFSEDRSSREGLYLKLAIATSLAHAKPNNSFDGKPIDPLQRYLHFKEAHKKRELDPMFDNLSAWELEKVAGSWGSDADLAWGREMLRTMRPELVIEKRYVRQVSEVQFTKPDWGNPPHRFSNVLAGRGHGSAGSSTRHSACLPGG